MSDKNRTMESNIVSLVCRASHHYHICSDIPHCFTPSRAERQKDYIYRREEVLNHNHSQDICSPPTKTLHVCTSMLFPRSYLKLDDNLLSPSFHLFSSLPRVRIHTLTQAHTHTQLTENMTEKRETERKRELCVFNVKIPQRLL